MPIKPTDILAIAHHLHAQKTEPAFRSAASRAYYAAYHSALSYADQKGLESLDSLQMGSHEKLSMRFEKGGDRSTAIMLKTMKSLRHAADYDLDKSVDEMQVKVQLQTAQKLIDKLAS